MTQGLKNSNFVKLPTGWVKSLVRAFVIVLMVAGQAKAVTLDAETHDILISKLGEVRGNLTTKDSSYTPTTLRMADLLSDRARLRDMDSMEKKGELSKEARQDRQQAVALIESVLSQLAKDQKVRAHLQRAQLYQLLDQSKKAEALLVEIRKTQKGTEEYWTATDLLADLNFAIGQYKESEKMYTEIQRSAKKNNFAQYRLAWCSLHQGQEQDAVRIMEGILKDPKLESGLRIEAARDMAIFYARVAFKSTSIQKILTASGTDVETQKSNLKLFAEELKRTGQKKESALVFLSYLQMKSVNEEETILTQSELFENLVHIGRNKEALPVLEKIVASKCEDQCANVQMRIHKTLRNWAALEKAKPSSELMRSFVVFGTMKPVDENALLFGIKTAQDAGQHKASLELLSILINNTRDEKTFEAALLANIQSAEKTKSQEQILVSYDLYLSKGKDAKLKNEIQRQRIQSLLALGKNNEAEQAAESFYRLSKDKESGEILLGIYQRTKQTEKERLLSLELSKGQIGTVYYANYKRLTLDLTKKRLDANLVDTSDYDMMIDIAAKSKDKKEKYKILSDAYLVALKIENFDRLKNTSMLLVETSNSLGGKEKDLALEKRMFVADLELDFQTSARLERQRQAGKSYDSAAAFRLVLKSRLAGRPDQNLEKKILRDQRANLQQRTWILQNQLQTAKNPFRLLRDNESFLSSHRELNSRFALMAMAEGREAEARAYLKQNPNLKRSVFGILLGRRDALVEMTREYRNTLKTPVATGSVNAFNRTLDQRLSAMNKFERKYTRNNRDTVLSLLARGYMSGIHLTLANDLDKASTRVPVPLSIKKDFATQLTQKASDLRKSVAQAEEQMENNWSQSGFEKEIGAAFDQAHSLQRKALLKEIALWKSQSYGVIQKSWSRLERTHAREEQTSLAGLYMKVQKNPFRSELTKELARAEEDRGNHLLSAFLIQRDRQLGGI